MRVPLAVLADYANVTAEGKLNIMGIFNRINAASMPAVHTQMRLVIHFQTDPADRGQSKQIDIKLLDADGKVLLALGSNLAISEDQPLTAEFNEILELTGLRFERFGDHSFHVMVNGETKAQIPFKVVPAQPPQLPPAQGE